MPLLFSYGTLQQEEVQLAIFDRTTHHTIVRPSGDPSSRIKGMVYQLTEAELHRADVYEVAAYKRIIANLASGREAWVYVDARIADAPR